MPPGKPRDPRKEQFWRRMIQRWRRSNLSIASFCRLHQLSLSGFYAWRRTLAQRDAQDPAFVPVQLLPEPLPPNPATAGLELLLPGGRVLRVGPAFDEATLQRLLTLLENRQS